MNQKTMKTIGGGIFIVGMAIAAKTGLLGGAAEYSAAAAAKPVLVFEAWSKDACACVDVACAETQAKRLDELIDKHPAQEGGIFRAAQAHADTGAECISKVLAAGDSAAKAAEPAPKAKKSRK
ncbi:MAG: hypothetical protein IPL79_03195 [Myxococcales bacterium]|nr:hypothetical protein [Myxococcales bacterium]